MDKLKNNTLTLSSNRNTFVTSNNNNINKLSSVKNPFGPNPFGSKSLLNQISFQSLVKNKSGTPKNFNNNIFSKNLFLANNSNNINNDKGKIYKTSKKENTEKVLTLNKLNKPEIRHEGNFT